MEVKTSKPFDKEYGPSDLNLGPNFPVAALFNLTPEEPFVEQPVRGLDGVYIIAYDKSIPSRIPPLAEIRSRVVTDYKLAQATRMAQINGHIFGASISNQLAQGKSFATVTAAAGVKPVEVAPFSLNSERVPEVEDRVDNMNTFKELVFNTPVGKATSFVPTREGGYIVYVRERLPIDEAKMKAALPQFTDIVRQRREVEAFDLWFRREASTALANIPALQQEQQQQQRLPR